jgi:nitrate reductase cytochrome c-type subunit
VLWAVTVAILVPSLCQERVLQQNAKQNNLVDVQFFADPYYQETRTPFFYSDFPPITPGSCTQCVNFPVSFFLCLECTAAHCIQVKESPVLDIICYYSNFQGLFTCF